MKFNKKTEDGYTKLILYVVLGTLFILASIIPGAYIFSSYQMHNSVIIKELNGINVVIGILAIISCAFYYNMYKSKVFFILTSSYIIAYIEYIFINIILVQNNIFFLQIENMIITPFLFRVILLTIALLDKSKLANFIIKRKKVSIFIILSSNIIGLFIEIDFRYMFHIFFSSKLMLFLNIFLMIYYVILLVLLARRSFQEKKFTYAIIASSLSILTFRRIFIYTIFSINNDILHQYNILLSFIAFLILIIGLLIKIDMNVKENERLKCEIENSEKKLLAITENIKELIFLKDTDGKIIYANEAAIVTLGYDKDELLGSSLKDILYSQKNEVFNKDYNILFADQEWKCKDGQLRSTESIINSIFDDNNNNNLISTMVVGRDYSFKSQLDKLKIKYNEMKELEIIKNQFFANLSHEIRTPINIIYSCIQLLDNKKLISNEALVESYKKYDLTIKQNCYRMLRLVNNIVDITKIDAGFMKANFGNYDIVSLVENIALSIVPYVESKNITVIFDTLVEELKIKCDPDNIERIILNLLSNAVKYTNSNGSIFVSIDSNDDWVTIKVKDDGIGIPEQYKESIFERFVQTDKSLNRQKEGSGIGLALAKSLVDFHNGKIYVSDNTDTGTEFVVMLPNIRLAGADNKSENPILETDEKSILEKISIEFSDIYDIY